MPVYEYMCSKGHAYERTEGFDAPSRQRCLTCGAPARRRISLPAVIFKGSGFYSTDNRKSGHSGNGSAASEPSAAKDAPAHADAPSPATETKVEAAKAD